MTALAKNTPRESRGVTQSEWGLVGADVEIFDGAILMFDGGYIVPAASSATNKGCIGLAKGYVDNTGGSAGDKRVQYEKGIFKIPFSSCAATAAGTIAYAEDDATADDAGTGDEPKLGLIVEYLSSTSAWVHVDPAFTR